MITILFCCLFIAVVFDTIGGLGGAITIALLVVGVIFWIAYAILGWFGVCALVVIIALLIHNAWD